MESGKLRQRGTFEQVAETQNNIGEAVETWSVFAADVPMRIRNLRGRELFAAEQVQSEVTSIAELRYMEGITTKMRLVHRAKVYNITFVDDVDLRGRWLKLMLSEGLRD